MIGKVIEIIANVVLTCIGPSIVAEVRIEDEFGKPYAVVRFTLGSFGSGVELATYVRLG